MKSDFPMRLLIVTVLAALALGCSKPAEKLSQRTGERSQPIAANAAQYRLAPWRKLYEGTELRTLATNPEFPDRVLVAEKRRLTLLRLKDGALLQRKEFELSTTGTLAWRGRRIYVWLYSGKLEGILVLNQWKEEDGIPVPTDYDRGFSVDKRNGTLYVATPDDLLRWDSGKRRWDVIVHTDNRIRSLLPPLSDGMLFTMGGLLARGSEFKPLTVSDGFSAFRDAWRSPSDPRLILVAGYPKAAISRDAGNTWRIPPPVIEGPALVAGYEHEGRRILFVESHSGKTLGGLKGGNSTLHVSGDDGHTFEKHDAPKTFFKAMVVVRNTLVIAGRDKAIWAADIVAEK